MKRYIAQYVPWTGGLYAVLDTKEGFCISDPKPHHEANDEAQDRNNGTYGMPQLADAITPAAVAHIVTLTGRVA